MLAKAMGFSTHFLVKSLAKICHFPACIVIAKDFAKPVWMVPLIIDLFSSHYFCIANTNANMIANAQCERTLISRIILRKFSVYTIGSINSVLVFS